MVLQKVKAFLYGAIILSTILILVFLITTDQKLLYKTQPKQLQTNSTVQRSSQVVGDLKYVTRRLPKKNDRGRLHQGSQKQQHQPNTTFQKHSQVVKDLKYRNQRLPNKSDQEKKRTPGEKLWLDTYMTSRKEPYQDPAELKKVHEELKRHYYGNKSAPAQFQIPTNSPDFKPVTGLGSILYVHAALWQGDNVRISTLKKLGKLDNILCVLWFSSDPRSNFVVVKALVKDLMSYTLPNACGYVKCFVKKETTKNQNIKVPLFVGLVHNESLSDGHRILIPVENRDMDPEKVQKWIKTGKANSKKLAQKDREKSVVEFTVCIPAVFNYRKGYELVEKLEMIKIMGAGRVVLYDNSIHPEVRRIIRLYQQWWAAGNETLEVVLHSWKTPALRMHYRGQLIAVEDCLNRYGWLSQYMVFNDMDELIIPLRHDNWSQLIAEREKLNPGYAAFMFRSAVFNRDHFTPAKGFEAEARRFYSMVFGFTKRDDYIFPPLLRSKIIINPKKVESLSVHHVYEGYAPTDLIPSDQGILYHYRWPVRPCKSELTDNTVVNRFGRRLLASLKSTWSKLKDVPLGKPIPLFNSTRKTCIPKLSKAITRT